MLPCHPTQPCAPFRSCLWVLFLHLSKACVHCPQMVPPWGRDTGSGAPGNLVGAHIRGEEGSSCRKTAYLVPSHRDTKARAESSPPPSPHCYESSRHSAHAADRTRCRGAVTAQGKAGVQPATWQQRQGARTLGFLWAVSPSEPQFPHL